MADWPLNIPLESRILAIASMAATLEAGDRARSNVPHGDSRIEPASEYAYRAVKLFDAVVRQEKPQ